MMRFDSMRKVREAASVVAGLVRLASDHKTNARDADKRARWCRSIVHTLERAGEVLGKVRFFFFFLKVCRGESLILS